MSPRSERIIAELKIDNQLMAKELRELRGLFYAQIFERAKLIHDIKRYIQIASNLATENEQLRRQMEGKEK